MKDYTNLHIKFDGSLKYMRPAEKIQFLRAIIATVYDNEFEPEHQELVSYLITTGRMFDAGRISKESEVKK